MTTLNEERKTAFGEACKWFADEYVKALTAQLEEDMKNGVSRPFSDYFEPYDRVMKPFIEALEK